MESGVACVRQFLEQTNAGLSFKAPKTAKSSRAIPLLSLTIKALRSHKAQQAQERLLFGPDYSNNDLVFPLPDGTPWPPDSLTASFKHLVKKLGIKGIRFHDLRHSHASQLLKANVHPKIVSERLGHSSIAITMDTYSHITEGIQREAVQKIDIALQEAMNKSAEKSG